MKTSKLHIRIDHIIAIITTYAMLSILITSLDLLYGSPLNEQLYPYNSTLYESVCVANEVPGS